MKSIVITLSILTLSLLASKSIADVGWAKIPRSVIGTKIAGEIRVMIIDTGIGSNLRLLPWVQYDQSEDYVDNHGHGTHVAGIVVYGNEIKQHTINSLSSSDFSDGVCSRVKIFSCKYFDPTKQEYGHTENTVKCLRRARDTNIDVINYSGGGDEPNPEEYAEYVKLSKNTMIVTAAGNEHKDLRYTPYYPASYGIPPAHPQKVDSSVPEEYRESVQKFYDSIKQLNNFYVVENIDEDTKQLAKTSNWHDDAIKEYGTTIYSTLPNNQYGWMTGTSQSAPAFLHKELKLKCLEMGWN